MPCVKKACLFSLFLFFFQLSSAQDTNCHLRISLLTCSPGAELYSTFGHTALRIVDTARHSDVVFNYGTFDFSDPDFYTKFVKGKLEYFLSVENYRDFLYAYQVEQRSIWEQELNLDCNEKEQMVNAINVNMQGTNRFYKYDFLYDNCTTRIRDLIFKNISNVAINKRLIPPGITSRDLIHSYLDKGGEPWSKLGIDILLGSKLDKPVTNNEAMFLPDYLMKGVDSAVTVSDPSIVLNKKIALQAEPAYSSSGKYVPLIVLSIITAIFTTIYFTGSYTIIKIADSLLLYLTGLLGILILFMWFGTEHLLCRSNFNILWALPTNFIAAFFIWKNPVWLKRYFNIAFFVYGLLFIAWFWLPQEINISVIPVLLLLFFRYAKLAN
jgi:hypothetical protein